MRKISLFVLLSLALTFLQTFTFAAFTSSSHENNSIINPQEQTIHKIIQWNNSYSGFFTNITVSGNHWILPAYISLSIIDCRLTDSKAKDYCWKPYLVMNDSNTNNTETFGSLYNYFDSPTLEWNESNPITQDFGGKAVIMGYDGNETMGLSETALVKSNFFLKDFDVELGLGGGLSFSPENPYLTSLQENKIIKDRVFYFHQDIPTNESNYTFNLTVGSIPDNRTNIYWTERLKHNNTWELEGEYVLLDGQEVGECTGSVYFADNGRIKMQQKFWTHVINTTSKHFPYYPCNDEDLDKYHDLTIYTKDVAIHIPARSYLDLSNKHYFDGDGYYCHDLFDDWFDSDYCAVLGFNIYKDQFIAFSLDKQAIGFDLNETYLVKMVTNEIELIVGAVSLVICLILTIWGNTFYYEKQMKTIEQEMEDYDYRQSVISLPESNNSD